MFKRPASTLTASQTRKRRRNGVSTSRAMLDLVETPLDLTQGMRVFHTNTEELGVARKSTIPLQLDTNEVQLEDPTLDEVNNMLTETTAGVRERKKRRKRKQQNDSVSLSNRRIC